MNFLAMLGEVRRIRRFAIEFGKEVMKACKVKLVEERTAVMFLFKALKFLPIEDMAILNCFVKSILECFLLFIYKI